MSVDNLNALISLRVEKITKVGSIASHTFYNYLVKTVLSRNKMANKKSLKTATTKRRKKQLDGKKDPLGEPGSKRKLKNGKLVKEVNQYNFKIFIHRLLKKQEEDLTISSKAMSIMNSFVVDIFERIAGEAKELARIGKSSTLRIRDIETGVKLVLNGELGKYAVSYGNKAVLEHQASRKAS